MVRAGLAPAGAAGRCRPGRGAITSSRAPDPVSWDVSGGAGGSKASSSSSGVMPGSSNGVRRRRCASTSGATRRRSLVGGAPTVPPGVRGRGAAQHEVGAQALGADRERPPERDRRPRRRARRRCASPATGRAGRRPPRRYAVEAASSPSASSWRRTAATRSSGSVDISMSTARPKRSSSCGRSSPSSGFIEPTSTKRAGWVCETPSRSIRLTPDTATSSSTSTRWSASRLISST